jgi:hypothetical protein
MKDTCKFCGDNPCLMPHCPYTPEELKNENRNDASTSDKLRKDNGHKKLHSPKRRSRNSVQLPRGK